jgi:hypothetical protein
MLDQVNKAVMNVISFLEVNDSNLETVTSFIHSDCSWFLSVCMSTSNNFVEQSVPTVSDISQPFMEIGDSLHLYKVEPIILT